MTTLTGGTAPYTFTWSNGDSTQNIDSLAAGNYNLTVTGASGCTDSALITLTAPLPILANFTNVPATCFGATDGAIDLTVTNGLTPVTYSWNTGDTSQDLTNITSGIYTVIIRDINSCTLIASDTVATTAQPFTISGVATTNYNGFAVSCPSASDGSIDITPSITGNYTYTWDNGLLPTEDQTNLPAGIYTVTASDTTGCQDTAIVQLNAPTPMTTNISVAANYNGSAISCFGANDAALDLTITDGIAPYQIQWSNGDTTQNITGVGADSTTVIITDLNGCMAMDTIFLTEPTAITSSAIVSSDYNGNDITCSGANDGAVDLTVTGGTMPYQYIWSHGDTIQDPDSLGVGMYEVVITDANGCTDTATVSIQAPANSIIINSNVPFAVCENGNNGVISLSVSGGNGGYTFDWSNGLPNSSSPSNLMAGIYTVTVTDSLGCFVMDTIAIDTLATPQVIFAADSTCLGLATTFTNNSIAPTGSTYAWDFDNDGNMDADTSGDATFFYPSTGIFTAQLIITTTDGCSDTAITNAYLEELIVDFSGLEESYCKNADVAALTGSPEGGVFSGLGIANNSFDPNNAPLGLNTITYYYTNSLGCSDSVSYDTDILQVPNLDAGNDTTVFVNDPFELRASGAQFYDWSPANGLNATTVSNPEVLLFETQTYVVTGTGANGCSTTDTITINVDNNLGCLKLREVFSPNGDNVNDTWEIECVSRHDNTVEVFNRWGQLVFSAVNYDNTWDGISVTGEELPEDSYFYVINITTAGQERLFRGAVTIVR